MAEIVSTSDTLGGKPRIGGTRVSVEAVWELHVYRGMEPGEIADELPTITEEEAEVALKYAREQDESMLKA